MDVVVGARRGGTSGREVLPGQSQADPAAGKTAGSGDSSDSDRSTNSRSRDSCGCLAFGAHSGSSTSAADVGEADGQCRIFGRNFASNFARNFGRICGSIVGGTCGERGGSAVFK